MFTYTIAGRNEIAEDKRTIYKFVIFNHGLFAQC